MVWCHSFDKAKINCFLGPLHAYGIEPVILLGRAVEERAWPKANGAKATLLNFLYVQAHLIMGQNAGYPASVEFLVISFQPCWDLWICAVENKSSLTGEPLHVLRQSEVYIDFSSLFQHNLNRGLFKNMVAALMCIASVEELPEDFIIIIIISQPIQ